MMVLGGSDVSATLDRHQEWQDAHVLAARAAPCASVAKVRQETVAQLGELDAKGDSRRDIWPTRSSASSVNPDCSTSDLPTEPVTVDPSRLRLERGRRFGDVWLAWKLWQALGLDDVAGEASVRRPRRCAVGRDGGGAGDRAVL